MILGLALFILAGTVGDLGYHGAAVGLALLGIAAIADQDVRKR